MNCTDPPEIEERLGHNQDEIDQLRREVAALASSLNGLREPSPPSPPVPAAPRISPDNPPGVRIQGDQ